MGTCCTSQQIQAQYNLFDEISQIEQINSEGKKQPCQPQRIMKFRNKDQQEHISLPLKQNYQHSNLISLLIQQEMHDSDFLDLMRQQKQFQELDGLAHKSPRSCRSTASNFNVSKNRKQKSKPRSKGGSVRTFKIKNRGELEEDMLFLIKNQQGFPLTDQKKIKLFSHYMALSYPPKSILKNPSVKKNQSRSLSQRHVSFVKRL